MVFRSKLYGVSPLEFQPQKALYKYFLFLSVFVLSLIVAVLNLPLFIVLNCIGELYIGCP